MCVLCREPILYNQLSSKLTQKGCDAITKANAERGGECSVKPGEHVHNSCRSKFCNPREIEAFKRKAAGSDSFNFLGLVHTLRSLEEPFIFSKHCLFCGKDDPYAGKVKDTLLIQVRTYDFQKKIILYTWHLYTEKWWVGNKSQSQNWLCERPPCCRFSVPQCLFSKLSDWKAASWEVPISNEWQHF